jgi:hypothetical protein
MLNWNDVLAQQERNKDLMREANNYRFARQAMGPRDKRNRFHRKALIWVGCRLVAWGSLLQARFGAPVETSALRPANHCR